MVDEKEFFMSVEGKRRVYDVKVGDEKLRESKTYNVSFPNYIGTGGDGYTMFGKYEDYFDIGKVDNQALMNYIIDALHGIIPDKYNSKQGRIEIVNKSDEPNNHSSNSFFLKKISKWNILILFIDFVLLILC